MTITVRVRHAWPSLQIDVDLRLSGSLTAVVGPSGAGKTTLLNVIAGVDRVDAARVQIDDDVLTDTTSGIMRPIHRRGIGYVFQEPRLFPHLTVRQNLFYGRWFRRGVRPDVESSEVIELLQLEPLLTRRPARLSGGEKQRVALGRALLASPRLLLLDEPLAAVDRAHRQAILPYLDRVRAAHAIPAIYVTHTWAEVESRADGVVVLEDGRVVSCGPPQPVQGHSTWER
jgi:molybdate transport system ATP-binding protein